MICFLNACYWSYLLFMHMSLFLIYLYFWACNEKIITRPSGKMTTAFLVTYDRCQTFSPLKTRPFPTIDCKLTIRFTSIQSTTKCIKPSSCQILFSFFHSDLKTLLKSSVTLRMHERINFKLIYLQNTIHFIYVTCKCAWNIISVSYN